VALVHVQLHRHQVALRVRLCTTRHQLARHADGAIAEVVGAVLHLLWVCVEVMPSHSDTNKQVAVLDVVDVDIPGVLTGRQAQRAQHRGVVPTLIGHLCDREAIDDQQVLAGTRLIPPELSDVLPCIEHCGTVLDGDLGFLARQRGCGHERPHESSEGLP